MSGMALSPKFSAEIASNVYQIKDELSRRAFKAEYKKFFNMEESTMATGTTGAFVILKKPHVMGFFAKGIGEYQNQAFVAFKGTASLYDALTDGNTGIRASHTGCYVHQWILLCIPFNDYRIAELSECFERCNGNSLYRA